MIIQDLTKPFDVNIASYGASGSSIILNYGETLEVIRMSLEELEDLECGLTDLMHKVNVYRRSLNAND